MKIAIVTGAAQGIGRRTAEVLAGAGFNLLLMDRQPCTATIAAVHAAGSDAAEVLGDLTEEAVIDCAVEVAQSQWGQVDVLVNNAGISLIAPAEAIDAKTFRHMLEVNLVAPFLLSKAFGALMLEQKSGSIVNVASIAGLVGVSDRSAYNASKHGLVPGLTRTLAAEWGGRGVRVKRMICPGCRVKTEMDIAADPSSQRLALHRRRHRRRPAPWRRFASPEDIAQAISLPRRARGAAASSTA